MGGVSREHRRPDEAPLVDAHKGYDRSVRVGTFNVHSWADAQGRGNADRVVRALAPLELDVLALQEVTHGGQLERVAGALGLHVSTAPAGWGINALLTRTLPSSTSAAVLDARGVELRSAALAVLDTPRGPLGVCATHLAHEEEESRLAQLEQLLPAMAGLPEETILLGDFNALRPTDYARYRWAEIAAVRARNYWEEPRGELVAALDALGWIDLPRLALAGELSRYGAQLVQPMPPSLAQTCRFATRVDYAWASAGLAATLASVQVEVLATDASDHRPVLVTLGG